MAVAPRRKTDPESRDWTPERGVSSLRHRMNGHTKWVVGVVSAGLVALAAWGLQNDRLAVERRLDVLDQRTLATETLTRTIVSNQSAQQAQSDARWESVKTTLERIERDVREMKTRR